MRLKPVYQSRKCDYHAHTKYSDGALTIEESIAKRVPYAESIGISDHYRFLMADGNKLSEYCEAIEQLRDNLGPQPYEIKMGVEIFLVDIPHAIKYLMKYAFDFIIIENFEYSIDQQEVMRVIAMLIEALQQCGRAVELILAHPDFEVWFGHLNREGNIGIDTMLTFLRENGIALEINVNTGYFFKKKDVIDALCDHSDPVVQALKQSETMLSIGTDSHGYEQVLFEGFNQVYAFFNEND